MPEKSPQKKCRKHNFIRNKKRVTCCIVCGHKRGKTGPKGPHKMKPDVMQSLRHAFAIGCNAVEACHYAGISKSTYDDWITWYPHLKEEFDGLRLRPYLKARQAVFDDLDKADTAKWFLERKRKDEFSTKIVSSETVFDGRITEEQARRVEEIMRENGEEIIEDLSDDSEAE